MQEHEMKDNWQLIIMLRISNSHYSIKIIVVLPSFKIKITVKTYWGFNILLLINIIETGNKYHKI
ncbi:MAG TPA: hypothetical protein VF220_02470 [Nitrososphaeraceae archaeon]